MTLQPQHMATLTQEEVDQIYGRLTAGPIPDGAFDGDLVFPRGADGDTRLARDHSRPVEGAVLPTSRCARRSSSAGRSGRARSSTEQTRLLRNRIDDLSVLEPILGDNPSRDRENQRGGPGCVSAVPRQALLRPEPARWPAGVGHHRLLVHRRTAGLSRANRTRWRGRDGLRIRDEIRMVRPGFYLGRAYLNRIFGLNFTLYNAQQADAGAGRFQGRQDL